MSMIDKADRFSAVKAAAPGDYSLPGAFESAAKAKPSRGGMGGTAPRTSAFVAGQAEGAASATTYTAPSQFATPKKSSSKSAAFSSQSGRFASPAPQGPASTSYDISFGTIGASAKKSVNKSGTSGGAAFGGTARRDPFGGAARAGTPRGSSGERLLRSDEVAPVVSSFGVKKVQSKGPSAAFAAGKKDRFAPKKDSTPDYGYSPAGMGSVKKSTAKSTTMGGKVGRFTPAKAAAPGDYSAFTSDFSKSKMGKAKSNMGFGGTAPRVSAVEESAQAAAKNAPAKIYDGAYTSTGAFSKATTKEKASPSAAFASKSRQQSDAPRTDGPAPGQYNTHAAGSMSAAKSFNKSVNAGGGSFGTNAKRVTMPQDDDAPGPGAYDAADGGTLFSRNTFKPSAAFASQSEVRPELRSSAAPSGVAYDPHKADGMAAQTLKTFNSKAGTGGFGGVVPREYHTVKETPGPGEYTQADPNAPTVESKLNANKGRVSGAFASSSLRDSMDWGNMFNR